MKIPFLNFEPIHSELKIELTKAFNEVYDSYWYILGEKVALFEKEYAAFNETKYAIGVSNGLDALVLSLKILRIGKNDEVIVPSNTYIASVLAISSVGAIPIFVEPDIETYNLDPLKIEEKITLNTKAIMPVHLYGQSCQMDKILNIAKKYSLFIVEDNAQAHGASCFGKLTGSWGDVNGTSFYPGKNLGALGDAGMITTNNQNYDEKARVFRNYGSKVKYKNEIIGNNMRLDELQASFLSVKLKYLKDWTIQRQILAGIYNDLLNEIEDVKIPIVAHGSTHVYHLYVIRVKNRDLLCKYLQEKGIGTLIHYPIPPHLQQAYYSLGYSSGDFPIAEEISRSCLSLPLWPGMTEDMVEAVCKEISNFYNNNLCNY